MVAMESSTGGEFDSDPAFSAVPHARASSVIAAMATSSIRHMLSPGCVASESHLAMADLSAEECSDWIIFRWSP